MNRATTLRHFNRSVWARMILCVFPAMIMSCCTSQSGQTRVDKSPRRAGDYAASAMSETLGGEVYGVQGRAMMQYRKQCVASSTNGADPYPAWLTAVLLQAAIDGTLFVQSDGQTCLRLPWIAADSRYWYFGNASVVTAGVSSSEALPTTALWQNFGAYVNSDPDVNEVVRLRFVYPLQNVEPGDILILEIYAVDRSLARYSDDIDLQNVVGSDRYRLLKLQLPVITETP